MSVSDMIINVLSMTIRSVKLRAEGFSDNIQAVSRKRFFLFGSEVVKVQDLPQLELSKEILSDVYNLGAELRHLSENYKSK